MTAVVNGHRQRILTSAIPPEHNINPEGVAESLTRLPRWLNWNFAWDGKKQQKKPYQGNGQLSSSTDSTLWVDFSTAVAIADRRNYGIGITFNGDGNIGIDIDDCRHPETGELKPWALYIVKVLDTYTEISPSGTGVKLFRRGKLPDRFTNKHPRPDGTGEVEIFDNGRYFTVTGRSLPGTPDDVQDRPDELLAVYDLVSGWRSRTSSTPTPALPPREEMSDDRATALAALAVLDPSCHYEDWLRIGMALHSVDPSPLMCAEYVAWSRNSDKFADGQCEAKWRSFGGEGVGIGTLCKMADQVNRSWRPARTRDSSPAGLTDEYIDSLQDNSGEQYESAQPDDDLPDSEIKRAPKLLIRSAGALVREFVQMRRMLIDGLLRSGEVMNVIAPPKLGKSWLVLSLVLCVAAGLQWLARFSTRRGSVLLVDNELHPETLADRLPRVAMAMGLKPEDYEDRISIICLRGKLMDLKVLSHELMHIEPGTYDLIVLDAWYRLQPAGSDENANGDVTQLYNLLESVSDRIGSAFVCIHHTSKGNQSDKSVTDVGSGAGAQARAADTHMVMRHHEVEGAIVVGASVRSWVPIDPFVVRFEFPLFNIDEHLDPADLKTVKPRKFKPSGLNDKPTAEEVRQAREQSARVKVLDVYRLFPDGETQNVLRTACGLSGEKFTTANESLIASGLVEKFPGKKGKQPVFMYRLTEGGQVGQVGQNDLLSDQSKVVGQVPPPLGGTVRPTTPPLEDDLPQLSDFPEFDTDGDY